MTQRDPPDVLDIKLVAQTRLFRVEEISLRFQNGNEVQFERLKSPSRGAVLVVPMLDDDTVLLIREYAAGVQRYELALPKGRMEEGEDILAAANREIMEEVGYGARQLRHLHTLTLAPSYLSHATHIVLAQNLYPERHSGDEPEEIEVVPWRLSALPDLLTHSECTEARSIAALFLARELLAQR